MFGLRQLAKEDEPKQNTRGLANPTSKGIPRGMDRQTDATVRSKGLAPSQSTRLPMTRRAHLPRLPLALLHRYKQHHQGTPESGKRGKIQHAIGVVVDSSSSNIAL